MSKILHSLCFFVQFEHSTEIEQMGRRKQQNLCLISQRQDLQIDFKVGFFILALNAL